MDANAARLVFGENKIGASVNFTPWLRSLGVSNFFLLYGSGFTQVNQNNSLGFSLRYFNIPLNANGFGPEEKAKEYELSIAYARKLSPHLSLGLTPKYIVSSFNPSLGFEFKTFAFDLSSAYNRPGKIGKKSTKFIAGIAITNIGPKVGYTSLSENHLPTNLGIGSSFQLDINDKHSISAIGEINKFLVPTPTSTDEDLNGILDFMELSTLQAMLGSFNDAPGGRSEELRELSYSFGIEYYLLKRHALRLGISEQHTTKGNRQFITLGAGFTITDFIFDISYLHARKRSIQNPLDQTVRLSLNYRFSNRKKPVINSI